MTRHPQRPIEVDPPSKRITAQARGEQPLRPGDVAAVKSLLDDAGQQLRAVLQDETILPETPMEAQSAMESAADSIEVALRRLESISSKASPAPSSPGGPTRQQGQFLAFIREFILRNEAGVAPSHKDFQWFFNLTPPSVNSMLIRLEQRGFIRRVPGKARAIEIICQAEWIPPLDRPFKF
jgi:hypothetical protein